MFIEVKRLYDNGKATTGEMYIDGKFECYTLEDTYNYPKVFGETRIPEGSYVVELRKEGGMVKEYNAKYPDHDGMLWLRDVPNFKYVYIHVGNFHENTDGCILVGKTLGDGNIGNSVAAYNELYPKVVEQLKAGYPVNIEVYSGML